MSNSGQAYLENEFQSAQSELVVLKGQRAELELERAQLLDKIGTLERVIALRKRYSGRATIGATG